MSRYFYSSVSIFIFLLLLFLSTCLFSLNFLRSSSLLFYWSVYVGIFIVSLHYYVPFTYFKAGIFVFFLGVVLLYIGHELFPSLFPFLSVSPYQFVLRNGGGHNHLGDLAGIILSVLLISPGSLYFAIPASLLIFGLVAISFSKSAFLGITVTLFALTLIRKKIYAALFAFVLVISVVVIAIYTQELSYNPTISNLQKIMVQRLHLNPKPLLSVRDIYFPQVIRAWQSAPLEHSLFGFGSGNYIYPSMKTGVSTDLTPTETHNILLSVFVENGILTLVWFIFFCMIVLYWGIKLNNPAIFIFIYLLANFQTDFTYTIPFFISVFFFLAGQSLHSSSTNIPRHSIFMKIGIFILILFILISGLNWGYQHNKKKSLDTLLTRASKSRTSQDLTSLINNLEEITPYQENELVYWSSLQENRKNYSEAVRLLEKLSVYSPRWYLLYLPHQLELQKKMRVNIKKYLEYRKKDFSQYFYTSTEKQELNEVCQNAAEMNCISE